MKYIKLFEEISTPSSSAKSPAALIQDRIKEFTNITRSDAKSARVLDVDSLINDFEKFLFSKIQTTLEKSKTGKGGEIFAQECCNYLISLIDKTLSEISWIKKKAINAIAPSRAEFKKESRNINYYDIYFDRFEQMIDFAYVVGWMPEFEKGQVNLKMADFSNQVTGYIEKNKQNILNIISGKIENFLYGPAK